MSNPTKVAYSPEEAAAASSLSVRSIWNAIARGELRSSKKGRRRLILARDLEAWLNNPSDGRREG